MTGQLTRRKPRFGILLWLILSSSLSCGKDGVGSGGSGGGAGSTPNPVAPSCTFAVQPGTVPIVPAGGTSSVDVTTSQGCNWSAVSNANWISITSGASGSGNGSVRFNVTQNTGSARTGTLTVATQSVTVQQGASSTPTACGSMSLDSAPFTNHGGSRPLTVTATTNCAWSLTSSAPEWLGAATSGIGNATLTILVQANLTNRDRTGTLSLRNQGASTVWEQRVIITQQASTFLEIRGNYTLVISVASGCQQAWPASMRVVSLPAAVAVDFYLNGNTDGSLLNLPIHPSLTQRHVRFSAGPVGSRIEDVSLLVTVGGVQYDMVASGLFSPVGVTRASDGRGEIINAKLGQIILTDGKTWPEWICGFENSWSLKIR